MRTSPKPALYDEVAKCLLLGFGPASMPDLKTCDPELAEQLVHLYNGGAAALIEGWREHGAALVQFADATGLRRPRGCPWWFAEGCYIRSVRGCRHPSVRTWHRPRGSRGEQLVIAFHESAHAVTALASGIAVSRISSAAPATTRARGYMVTSTEALSPADADRLCASRPALVARGAVDGRLVDVLTMFLAGGAAEERLGQRIPDGAWDDRRQVEVLLGSVLRVPPWSGRVHKLMGVFDQRAAAAVERYWPWIERVAHALDRAQTLSGAEVLRLRDATTDEETARQRDEPSAAARARAHAIARAFVDSSRLGGSSAELADVLAQATRQFVARNVETQAGLR